MFGWEWGWGSGGVVFLNIIYYRHDMGVLEKERQVEDEKRANG
jgi:hypothetical protein